MNEHSEDTERIALAWQVETVDITARVSAAIGSREPGIGEVLAELRATRRELGELRRTTAMLQEEILRLRQDVTRRPAVRIAPFAPSEGAMRLS